MFVRYPLVPSSMALSLSAGGLAAPLLYVGTRSERLLAVPLWPLLHPEADASPLYWWPGAPAPDPRWFVSHGLRLAGLERVESFVLPGKTAAAGARVVGSDLFSIVLHPSGQFAELSPQFPRGALLAVLAALLVAVIVTQRMATARSRHTKWH